MPPSQNERRTTRRLTLPVLGIGGARGVGGGAANTMEPAADDVQSVVIPGCGHYCLEGLPRRWWLRRSGRSGHAKGAALIGLRSASEGKFSSGLDVQVRVPDPAGNAQKGRAVTARRRRSSVWQEA
jgi:hypothetical protein